MNGDDVGFGSFAIREGACTEEQVRVALDAQKQQGASSTAKPLGEILAALGFLSRDRVDALLARYRDERLRFAIAGYELREKLGQGSMGVVYKARQLSLDRIVAIKILPPELAENQAFVRRFMTEARAVAKLNHPNVIQGIDVGDSGGYRYFVMEYVDGLTVGQILRRGGPLDEARALRIISQIAAALDHAYRNRLVHRDVKPDNIMITEGGLAKLCDLGLAREERLDARTVSRGALGTPNYASPEQARGDADVDIRSDIYSLGATYYHMIVGEPPFTGTNNANIMAAHLTKRLVPPIERNPELSGSVSRLVERMMAKDPNQRPQTPGELITEIERARAEIEEATPPSSRRGGNFENPLTQRRRRLR
ncbi:MAG: serine/threonine protein kinase [Planctomycetes bacterium]|nr:serine/threonine protein kinase [Planctomycetota bacterium]MBI3847464.1 serine/threonine protein kinase [Planctomycetota bacterium]